MWWTLLGRCYYVGSDYLYGAVDGDRSSTNDNSQQVSPVSLKSLTHTEQAVGEEQEERNKVSKKTGGGKEVIVVGEERDENKNEKGRRLEQEEEIQNKNKNV